MKFFKHMIFLGLASATLTITSCKDDMGRQEMPELKKEKQIENIKYTGEFVTIGLDVALPNQGLSKTRSFAMTKDGDLIKVDYGAMLGKPMKVYFALRKNGMPDNQVTYFSLDANIIKEGNIYKLKAQQKNIQMNVGGLDNEYYIQAVTFGPGTDMEGSPENGGYTYNMESKSALIDDNAVVASNYLNVPLGTNWTKIGAGDVNIKNLTFNPMGSIIRFNNTNKLADAFTLKKIKISTKGLANKGVFRLGKLGDNGVINTESSILFEPQGADADGKYNLDMSILENLGNANSFRKLESKDDASCYVYVMPVNSGRTCIMGCSYVIEGDNDGFEQTTEEVTKKGNIESGRVYRINETLPKSDLMITEFFHCNPGGNNYSMIEIYNPTSEKVDLSRYGLLRVRTVKEDKGPGIHPGDETHTATNSLWQQIYINPNTQDDYQPALNAAGQPYWQYGNPPIKPLTPNAYIIKYKYLYGTQANANDPYLLPKQSVVLCSKQLYWYERNNETENKQKYYPNGTELGFDNKILDNIREGKCKYVLAVTNTSDDVKDYQHEIHSGTLTHGLKHIMILAKHDKDEDSRTVKQPTMLDATGPVFNYLDMVDENGDYYGLEDTRGWKIQTKLYQSYLKTLQLDQYAGKGDRDDVDLIRRSHIRYPNLIFKYDCYDENHSLFNNDPNREWDLYMLPGSINIETNSMLKSAEEKGKLHSWGSR